MEINKVYCGNCIDVLKGFKDNFFDSVVTDPPYELGFMGKSWDKTGIAYNVDMWKEVLRVLKPGGHLLSFGGTRTYHRMACAIEDAGFEIRDQIQWLYGCLSDDTEVLTRHGWVQHRISKEFSTFVDDEILIYDVQNDIYKWEKPERWNEYNIIKDTAYHIQSDNTDQIVSRNHRCLVEREGKLIFLCAEELSDMESMPTLSNDILMLPKRRTGLLQSGVQWVLQRTGLEEMGQDWVGRIKSKPTTKSEQRREKPRMERGNNIQAEERVLCQCEDKVRCLSEGVYSNGKKGRICDGVQACDGNADGQTVIENRVRSSHRPQPTEQRYNESDVIRIESGSQTIRVGKTYHSTLATVTPIEYSGIIFCPTVSTGAFVARRNGQIFLTGNSGFPKSLNIGKAVDALQGNEREDLGYVEPFGREGRSARQGKGTGIVPFGREEGIGNLNHITKGNSEYEGWGTALKPANEPICMARKPLSEKTIAQNVLKWGTGGINIDGCRVEYLSKEDIGDPDRGKGHPMLDPKKGFNNNPIINNVTIGEKGRFPANVILSDDEEVLNKFPNTKSGLMKQNIEGGSFNVYGKQYPRDVETIGDGGSASRFFYCAKASKSERNKGLDDFEKKEGGMRSETSGQHITRRDGGDPKPVANNHPTVKPISLMQYLCRLITPPNGIVLDPFAGSGSTLIGAKVEKFNYVGVEKEENYVEIANARIKAWTPEIVKSPKFTRSKQVLKNNHPKFF